MIKRLKVCCVTYKEFSEVLEIYLVKHLKSISNRGTWTFGIDYHYTLK